MRAEDTVRPLVSSIARFAVPSVLYIALVVWLTGGYSLANVMRAEQTDPEKMDEAAAALRERLGVGEDGRA